MKQVKFILQGKGGVGKSLLTWLVYEKQRENPDAVFLDIDSATKTSFLRLPESAVRHFDILKGEKEITDKTIFFRLFEAIAKSDKSHFYCDLGATESSEFEKLLRLESMAQPEKLRKLLSRESIELSLWVVVAGSDALTACIKFLTTLTESNKGIFPIRIYLSAGRFKESESDKVRKLLPELAQQLGVEITTFGDLSDDDSSLQFFEYLNQKGNTDVLGFGGRMRLADLVDNLLIA